ncbi:MAG: CheR family methyltransferase, partial [Thermoanaerobaculia bacterium]
MARSVPPALLAESSDLVAAVLGLHFPQERWSDLGRGLAAAAPDLGEPDADAVARRLRARSLSRAEIEILASHLTIGETYFFRDPDALRLFEETIVPEVRRAREHERRIRIWSAGCATGEEPYSIAMLLDRVLPPESGWEATILGTDINPRFLRKAAEGIYGAWSFRAMPPGARERWFRSVGKRRWELDPRIRGRVTFVWLNLATDPFPALVSETNGVDVIFCRNVLMYFARDRAEEVARKFHAALAPGGWLVVGPAETSATTFSPFEAVHAAGRTVYRKGLRAGMAPVRPHPVVASRPTPAPA